MIKVKFDTKQFLKDMDSLVGYSNGFLDGVQLGKKEMISSFAVKTIESLKQYIDSNARVDPASLRHMYEWSQSGSPSARLFDLDYRVTSLGLSINSTFKQSISIQNGSKEPFYDKARIMEEGIPVTIRPVSAKKLAFNIDGEPVFTDKTVRVSNPGGDEAKGSYEAAFENFFNNYFSQAFIRSSGILGYLENPKAFTDNMGAGIRIGKSKGIRVGYQWVSQTNKVN